MNTQEMINKAKEVSNDRKAYGIMQKTLVKEVTESGENYFESPRWQNHEKIVRETIKNESDKGVRKALEGLLL